MELQRRREATGMSRDLSRGAFGCEPLDVNRYTLAFDRLVAAELHPDESVQLIDQASSGMT